MHGKIMARQRNTKLPTKYELARKNNSPPPPSTSPVTQQAAQDLLRKMEIDEQHGRATGRAQDTLGRMRRRSASPDDHDTSGVATPRPRQHYDMLDDLAAYRRADEQYNVPMPADPVAFNEPARVDQLSSPPPHIPAAATDDEGQDQDTFYEIDKRQRELLYLYDMAREYFERNPKQHRTFAPGFQQWCSDCNNNHSELAHIGLSPAYSRVIEELDVTADECFDRVAAYGYLF
ncbi:hypothetical protein H0H81_009408 [Sphagnurus paluster]|uniref:Uncharacterized protein n=1 Tax=Sphagnurus paluster TaxID=117069 RepID=A0A9P7G157_9AGAR|nr:hypothetical protein H0H81_009408 [Sphagnurus paluster]